MRSRTDCAIVFAVTSSIVKNTAKTTDTRIMPMLPTCSRNCLMKTRSVAVLVSSDELANIASMRLATFSDSSGFADLDDHPADHVLAELQRFVEVVVLKHRAAVVPARAVLHRVDADDVELPGVAVPSVLRKIDDRSGMRCPTSSHN